MGKFVCICKQPVSVNCKNMNSAWIYNDDYVGRNVLFCGEGNACLYEYAKSKPMGYLKNCFLNTLQETKIYSCPFTSILDIDTLFTDKERKTE